MEFLIDASDGATTTPAPEIGNDPRFTRGESPLKLFGDAGLRILLRVRERDPECHFWEERPGDSRTSFVYVLGWCYRIGASAPSITKADLARMLERHRAGDPPADDDLSGNYVIVAFDSGSGRLAAQPDSYAWGTVHVATVSGRVVVSNRAALVASLVRAPIDGHAVFSQLRATHFPFGRSLFAGVRRVLSGCYVDIDTRALRASVRRATPLYVETRKASRREAAELVTETVRSLARRLTFGEETVFDLTGGMDTRLLAAGIRRESPPGIGSLYTWSVVGPDDLADVRVAREVAEALGWPFRRLDRVLPGDAEPSELEKDAVFSDGAFLVDVAFTRLRHEAQEGGSWGRAGGMGGELLRGWLWQQEFLAIGRSSRLNYSALVGYRLRPSRVFDRAVLGSQWPSLQVHDDVLLRPYHDIDAAGGDRLNAYKLDVIAQHKLIYLAYYWLAGIRGVRLPFVSHEFSRLVLSLPWGLRSNRRLLLQVMERLSPELRRIPTSKGEPMVPLGLGSLPLYTARGLSEVRRSVPFLLARFSRGRLGKQPVAPPSPPRSWIAALKEAKYVRSFVEPSFIESVCEPATPTTDTLRAFYTLLTLELLCGGLPDIEKRIVFREADSWV